MYTHSVYPIAGTVGVEPTSYTLTVYCSHQLSYFPFRRPLTTSLVFLSKPLYGGCSDKRPPHDPHLYVRYFLRHLREQRYKWFWINKILFGSLTELYLFYDMKATEKKKTFTHYCTPSIRKKAARRAKKEGGNLSSVIEQLLELYNNAPEWKYVETGKPINILQLWIPATTAQTPDAFLLKNAPV